ncbi:acetyl-CoA carboxylase biotin carboxylase subunit family protein [Adlercreutzia sp. ZJ138]|uniref:ATP-grasp domain-containing protein n=1 Tax=Adlercreutzia sp. ZJ138 TaxID=2709405 RepID=UPI0013EA808B|nr:ATP-grasp domain-containing protein [Adlercreutzia sp. ZJ138]
MGRHRLIILGGMDEFVDLVKTANERNIYTIVCDGYEGSPAKKYADRSYTINVRDIEGVAAICEKEEVDGIITSFSDILAECMVEIAAKVNIPCYASPESFKYLREKPLMKQMFHQLGIPSPETVKVHKETIRSDIGLVGLPCVVKPSNGYGSRGVYVLNTINDALDRFDEVSSYSSSAYIIAEKLMRGHEFNMMNWMVDGDLYTVSIADRETSSASTASIPYVSRCAYPSRLIDVVYEPAREIVKKIAEFVGIETGPISMQFFYNEEDGIQVCEVAGRLFGYEHELVTISSGLSIEDLLLDQVYDHDSLKKKIMGHTPFFAVHSAGLYFHGREGVVSSILDAERVTNIPQMVEAKFYYLPGEIINHSVGAKPYTLRCYIKADDRNQLDSITANMFEEMSILNESGEEVLYRNKMTEY